MQRHSWFCVRVVWNVCRWFDERFSSSSVLVASLCSVFVLMFSRSMLCFSRFLMLSKCKSPRRYYCCPFVNQNKERIVKPKKFGQTQKFTEMYKSTNQSTTNTVWLPPGTWQWQERAFSIDGTYADPQLSLCKLLRSPRSPEEYVLLESLRVRPFARLHHGETLPCWIYAVHIQPMSRSSQQWPFGASSSKMAEMLCSGSNHISCGRWCRATVDMNSRSKGASGWSNRAGQHFCKSESS